MVCRYYRAPELIALSSKYTETIDTWSAGCIFAELLHTLEPNASGRSSARILFPGDSAYPVSATSRPDDVEGARLERELRKSNSMFTLIRQVIGSPTSQDIEDLTDSQVMRDALRKLEPTAAISLARKYKASSDASVHLLQMMLRWNPRTRIIAADCLRHGVFANIDPTRGGGIKLDHAHEVMSFPFEWGSKQTKESLRQLILAEVRHFEEKIPRLEGEDHAESEPAPEAEPEPDRAP